MEPPRDDMRINSPANNKHGHYQNDIQHHRRIECPFDGLGMRVKFRVLFLFLYVFFYADTSTDKEEHHKGFSKKINYHRKQRKRRMVQTHNLEVKIALETGCYQ